MGKEYIISELGNERILIAGNKEYRTYYSRRIIELLIKREGLRRAGTGWRNSSYYELLPKSLMIDIKDLSEEVGYFCESRFANLLSRLFDAPAAFFTPSLNVVFRKEKDYE